MKNFIRTMGIDDAAFQRKDSQKTFIFGVIVRGYNLVEGILRTSVKVDGWDATERIIQLIKTSKVSQQLKAVIFGSATIAAFNIIDLNELYREIRIPLLVILQSKPNEKEVRKALQNLGDWEERLLLLNRNPPMEKISFDNQIGQRYERYIQHIGFKNKDEIKKILHISTYTSAVPECLRIADLIGQSFKDYIF